MSGEAVTWAPDVTSRLVSLLHSIGDMQASLSPHATKGGGYGS